MTPTLEWGVANRTRRGEIDSGDRGLVVTLPHGAILAAVDGLGHGGEAAIAAELAVRTIERYASRPLVEIIERCHQSLVPTRGAAVSIAAWDAKQGALDWIAVGNVAALLLGSADGREARPERLVLRGGVVGGRLPPLQASRAAAPGGALLIFATDGVAQDFDRALDRHGRPQALADQILARHARGDDDALVLVARLEGTA